MKETFVPLQNSINKKWFLVDAKGKTLGRLSTEIAKILRGKNKAYFTPYLDTGDYVVVINAGEVTVSGNKESEKLYRRHSGRPGGLKVETLEQVRRRLPHRILEKSVKGMLPKGPLGRQLYKKLKVYSGSTHSHQAQKPELINI
jgi:large subunit ribosomal protein L13|tara:strand:+ start:10843 stop:11274 length:432 start_codon:yes stop_codon:yes gene_type:complete